MNHADFQKGHRRGWLWCVSGILLILQALLFLQCLIVTDDIIRAIKHDAIESIPVSFQYGNISVHVGGNLSKEERDSITAGIERVSLSFPLYDESLAVSVYYFPNNKELKAGYYSIPNKDIVLYSCESETVAHELVHAYNHRFMGNSELKDYRIDEGIAEYFKSELFLPYDDAAARAAYEIQKASGTLSYDFCRECVAWLIERGATVEDILQNSDVYYAEFENLFKEREHET